MLAVKHVVGAEVDEPGARLLGGQRDALRDSDVERDRGSLVRVAHLGLALSGAVHHDVGALRRAQRRKRVLVAQIALDTRRSDAGVARCARVHRAHHIVLLRLEQPHHGTALPLRQISRNLQKISASLRLLSLSLTDPTARTRL
jgi:hypothetical protein